MLLFDPYHFSFTYNKRDIYIYIYICACTATKTCHKSNDLLSSFSITFLKDNIFKGYMYLPIMTCLSAEMIINNAKLQFMYKFSAKPKDIKILQNTVSWHKCIQVNSDLPVVACSLCPVCCDQAMGWTREDRQ